MATVTLGSFSQTILTALQFTYGMTAADFATISAAVKHDSHNPGGTQQSGGPGITGPQPPLSGVPFDRSGVLVIPNRGVLRLYPGDYVGVDTTGWPILLSARAAGTGASWVHT